MWKTWAPELRSQEMTPELRAAEMKTRGDAMAQAMTDQLNKLFDRAERANRFLVAPSRPYKSAILRRMCRGDMQLLELVPGIYARREYYAKLSPKAREYQLIHSLSAKHPAWVFCGISAAVLHGLYVSYDDLLNGKRVVVEVAGRRQPFVHELVQIRFRHLAPSPFVQTHVNGIPVTSVVDTVIECARSLPFPQALAVMDSAILYYEIHSADVARKVDALGKRARGVCNARKVIRYANGLSENGGESIARGIMIEEGFRVPELQVPVFDQVSGEEYRVDYYWRLDDGSVIFGEFDGGEKFESKRMRKGKSVAQVARAERIRESRLTLQGAKILRFTPEMLANRAEFVRLLEAYGVPRDGAG